MPHAVERTDALPTISRLLAASPDMEVIWLSDGVDLGRGSEFVTGLARATEGRTVSVVTGGLPTAHALAAADNAAGALTVKVLRASTGGTEDGIIRALDLKGLPLGEARFAFKDDERETDAEFDLPVEIRNDIARLEIAGERSAGAVQLLDKRWRRRTVGVVSGSTADTAQPLLASTYYLSRALNPFADVRLADVASPAEAVRRFIEQNVPMIILADVGNVSGEARDRLVAWIEDGGVLVRFAGPRLAGVRRRSRAGEASPRRPHARRQPELGPAAAARRLLARRPVRQHAGAEGRHRHAPGAGRAGSRPRRAHLGDARRRHAAGHRRPSAARA